MFATIEKEIVKKRILIAEFCPRKEAIARSQARRILQGEEQFQEIELDFTGIEFLGQGFADEAFRVFCNQHPEVKVRAVNACDDVVRMVKHVTAGQKNMK